MVDEVKEEHADVDFQLEVVDVFAYVQTWRKRVHRKRSSLEMVDQVAVKVHKLVDSEVGSVAV